MKKGNIFGFLGSLSSSVSVFQSFRLYTLVDPSFSMFTNWISDLGSGPNDASFVFNYGMMVSSLFLLIFQLCIARNTQKRCSNDLLTWGLYVSSFFSAIGLFFVGLIPLSYNHILHGIGADFLFFGMMFFRLLYGFSELIVPKKSKSNAIMAFILAGVFGVYIVISLINLLIPEYTQPILYFTEWLTLLMVQIWMVDRLIFILVKSAQMHYDRTTIKKVNFRIRLHN